MLRGWGLPRYVLGCLVGAFLLALDSPVWAPPPNREWIAMDEPSLEDTEPEEPAPQQDEPEATLHPSPGPRQ
jgi:hypothetical protein